MKNNYKTTTFMKSLISSLAMLMVICLGTVMAQTTHTVFTDDFNRGATANPLSAGGVPEMDWTSVTTVSPVTSTGARTQAALIPDATDDYALRIYPGNSTDGQGTTGRTYAYGTLSTYANQFNGKLSDNTGPITWTFSFRTNRATAFSGFDANQYGLAVVLAANGSNLLTASGYAVIMNRHASTSPKNSVSLVKFASGIDSNSKITSIIGPSPTESTDDLRIWFNVKVVYTPSTDTWELYVRRQPGGTYADKGDPTTVNTLVGSTADNTYTGSTMTHCGFLFNHSAVTSSNVNSNTVYIDDFKVTVFDPSPVSSVQSQNSADIKVISEENRIRINGAKNTNCKIFNVSGQLVAEKLIQSEDEMLPLSMGLYLVKLGNNNFKVLVK